MANTISSEITRLTNDKTKLRSWTVGAGLTDSTANLDAIATAVAGISVIGATAAQVKEGETYTIPAGYHSGNGTVAGVSGGGNYTLESKTVTPTKAQQSVSSDDGYYGLSSVTVDAIPAAYQDVTSTTATADTVLATKIFVDSTGQTQVGTMTNNGATALTIDGLTATEVAVPAGYTSGGTVSLTDDILTALQGI